MSDILGRFRWRLAGSPVSVPSPLSDEAADDERDRLAGAALPTLLDSKLRRGDLMATPNLGPGVRLVKLKGQGLGWLGMVNDNE